MLLKYLCFCGSENTHSSKKHYPMVTEVLCHQFSLEDLKKSTNNFNEKLIVGKGGFSTVYQGCLGHNGATDYTIALKLKGWKSDEGLLEFTREIELLSQLHHPNLISLVGFCNHEKKKIIVYEYMCNGSLHDHLYNRDMEPLLWQKRLEICIGVARGLHYLHTGAKRSIFHRDIKPSNILLDNNMVPKLSDFGLSLQGPLSTSKPKSIAVDSVAGTFGYLAPECFQQLAVSDKCDVYSFGVVLLEVVRTKDKQMFINKTNMLAKKQWGERASEYPKEFISDLKDFSDDPNVNMMNFIEWFPVEEILDPIITGKIAPKCWEIFMAITQRCLKMEPDERPTMGEVEVLLELGLSLQEEADLRRTDGDYTLLSTTFIDKEPTICIDGKQMLCHQFSLADLKQATYNFTESRIVGRGSFGTMYLGHVRLNGPTRYSIAIKKIDWSFIYDGGMQWSFKKEIENIYQLCHPNLISLLGFCDHYDEKILVYMYMPYGSLLDQLHGRHSSEEALSWKKRLEICIGAAQGLEYLHIATIFHRNIKLSNILLDYDMVPKLSDFGFPWSKPIHAEGYAAPEWFQGHDFTDKCDVYSFGVVLLQMVFTDKLPIIKGNIYPILKGKIAPQSWEVFLNVTQRCLKFEANERPTMSEVKALLQHALALQEEADANTTGDYSLLSATFEAVIGGSSC